MNTLLKLFRASPGSGLRATIVLVIVCAGLAADYWSSFFANSNKEELGVRQTQSASIQDCWKQVAQHLNQGSVAEAVHLVPNSAWQTLLMVDITYWTAYTWEEEVVSGNKALARVQFQEASKPVVLTFCKVEEQWRFQGLYLYRMPWAYLVDSWETVLEEGRWTQRVGCR